MKCEFHVILLGCMMIVTASCAQSAHQTGQNELQRLIPADVLSQVDESVSFTELRADPHQYVGKTVMFSGVALKSRRVKDGTEIEILQVPTQRGMSPSDRKARSEGRFLAVQSNGFLDPAVIEKDTPLTVVGEVKSLMSNSSLTGRKSRATRMATTRRILAGTADTMDHGPHGTTGSAAPSLVPTGRIPIPITDLTMPFPADIRHRPPLRRRPRKHRGSFKETDLP
jgi:hypothetical protein